MDAIPEFGVMHAQEPLFSSSFDSCLSTSPTSDNLRDIVNRPRTIMIRTRFAPSPTGYLHVGGARTALFSWLFARKHGGSFVLRIEDTDAARNTEAARQAILDGLRWLGLDWDEGPEVGGAYGPYYQSERQAIYDQHFEQLQSKGRVYESEGAWRFRFEREPIVMHDLVCGEVTIDYRDESNTPDMVIKRSDGSYVFHFVNVVDDLEMKISHVIRGEDHLMNTPKHLQLFSALGAQAPHYAHIPLILNADGSKMSKRDAGAAVGDYPRQGFLSSAVINFLALLGWSPKSDEELFSVAELIARFDLASVNRAPARFDWEKCAWFNQQHLHDLDDADVLRLTTPFLRAAGLPQHPQEAAMVRSVRQKVRLLEEIPAAVDFYYADEVGFEEAAWQKIMAQPDATPAWRHLLEQWQAIETWQAESLQHSLQATAAAHGIKPGALMYPLRIAMTGRAGGPDLTELMLILGSETCQRRLQRFVNLRLSSHA